MKRAYLSGLALAAAMLSAPAYAATPAATLEVSASRLNADDWAWQDTGTGRLAVVVSLPDQRAYVYRGNTMIAAASVSTGKDGKETPVGSYAVLQKALTHNSNKYDDAPMPFMQRLTWDGLALHAGVNPGFPASHGCVRMPTAFAKKLYGATKLGTTVTVVDNSVVETDPDYTPEALAEKARAETAKANEDQLSAISQPDE